jgi:hypothetical protein
MVQIIVEPKSALVGEEITVTIKSNIQGEVNLDFGASFVQGNSVMSGSLQEVDYTTGKAINYFYLSQNGTYLKEGSYILGPAYIKKGKSVYKSNIVTIKIEKDRPVVNEDITSRQLKKPAFGLVGRSKSKMYEGESIVLSAKVFSRFNPTHIDGYDSYQVEGAFEKHELGGGQQIMVDEKNLKGLPMFCFEYNRQLIFPTQTGKLTVHPFKMTLKKGVDGYTFSSDGSSIDVLPLPAGAPSDFAGGVGEFSVSRSIDKSSLKQGDVLTLTVVVSGRGNLQNIANPVLKLPKGMIQYGDPIIEDDYSYGNLGAQGKIRFKFNIQAMKDGILNLPKLTWTYFDPVQAQYVTLEDKSELIQVVKDANFTVVPSLEKKEESITDSFSAAPLRPIAKSRSLGTVIRSPFFLPALFSPLCLAFLLIFLKKRRDKNAEKVEEETQYSSFHKEAWEAVEMAKKELDRGHSDNFYASLEKAIKLLCAAKLKKEEIILGGKKELFHQLQDSPIDESTLQILKDLFQLFEEARYGWRVAESAQEITLRSVIELMQSISKQLRSTR